MNSKSTYLRLVAVFVTIFSSLLLLSCGHGSGDAGEADVLSECDVIATRDVVHGDTVINCHLSKVDPDRTLRIPLSMLIDSLEIIRLENTDEALASMGICDISDNYITVVEMMRYAPIKLYARDGRFISEIGRFGQGPGEYFSRPYEVVIDEDDDRMFIYPNNTQKILEYDLTGSLIREIPLAFPETGGHINVDFRNKRILVVQIYFDTSTFKSGPPVWIQDFEGNAVWHTYDPIIKKMKGAFANYPALFGRDRNGMTMYFSRYEAISDTLFYADMASRRIRPLFTMTFNGEVPSHNYYDVGRYYVVDQVNWPGQPEVITDFRNRELILDKGSLRGGYCEIYNDLLGGIDIKKLIMSYMMTSNGNLTIMIDPGDLLDKIESRLGEPGLSESDTDILNKLKSEISAEDNCYILHGKFKQPQ